MVNGLRAAAKTSLRQVVSTIAPRLWKLSRRPRLLIVMYHRVLPRGHAARHFEQPGMIVSPETLAMNIRVLREHFTLMHVDEWVNRARSGAELPPLACALTFDDGWRDNFSYAFPVLRAEQAPATIYLVSGFVGSNYGFWPTTLARLLCSSWLAGDRRVPEELARRFPVAAVPVAVPADSVRIAANALVEVLKATQDDVTMRQFVSDLQSGADAAAEPELLSWDQINEMKASGLVRFGSHTCAHTRLCANVDPDLARSEIEQSAAEIERQLKVPVTAFCYPNGDHAPHTVELVRRRYSSAVTTRFGWNDTSTDPVLLRRVGVHDDVGDTPCKLLARLAAGL